MERQPRINPLCLYIVNATDGRTGVMVLELNRHRDVARQWRHASRHVLQQVLLITDGTVTEIIETYAAETMRVVKLSQRLMRLDRADANLEAEAGERALRRKILLQGAQSGTTYLYADSLIAVDRLNDDLKSGLLLSRKPIGYLIREQRLETFREILEHRVERAGRCASYFGVETDSPLISRTYSVIAGGWPIMVITEKFPRDRFTLD